MPDLFDDDELTPREVRRDLWHMAAQKKITTQELYARLKELRDRYGVGLESPLYRFSRLGRG